MEGVFGGIQKWLRMWKSRNRNTDYLQNSIATSVVYCHNIRRPTFTVLGCPKNMTTLVLL